MKLVEKQDLDRVISFLREHIDHCVYLYIDIVKYGVEHPDITLWYTEDSGKIKTVAMKYYDSFQLYSLDPYSDKDKLCKLLKNNPVMTVSGEKKVIEAIEDEMANEYEVNYGFVVKETNYREVPGFEKVETATTEDCLEIARLMCSDEEFGSNYEVQTLAKQLINRIETGIGRNYVIREAGEIVAHVSVFAEAENIAVESGLIADSRYKNRFYGMIIHEYILKVLIEEGKTIYGFRINQNMKNCTAATDDNVCGHYGKMTRR